MPLHHLRFFSESRLTGVVVAPILKSIITAWRGDALPPPTHTGRPAAQEDTMNAGLAWLTGLVCLVPIWPSALAQDSAGARVVLNGDRLSITSSGLSRGQLLDRLRARYQIEVRPYLAPDDRINLTLTDVPIDSAIALIMPRGSRYVVRFGERDVARGVANTGPKRGASTKRPSNLIAKGATPVVRGTGPRFKPAPDSVGERPATQGRVMKPDAGASRDVPPGRGPKTPAAPVASDRTLRISFFIRAPDSVRVVRTQLIDGTTTPSTIVRGPFLFAFRNPAGGLVYFGSMLDPLEEHSYDTTGTHGQTRAREGTFAISIPERVVSVRLLGTLQLQLYDARNVSLPASLDAAAFQRATAQARTVARVGGRALVAALR
jgi:hypothetical protein